MPHYRVSRDLIKTLSNVESGLVSFLLGWKNDETVNLLSVVSFSLRERLNETCWKEELGFIRTTVPAGDALAVCGLVAHCSDASSLRSEVAGLIGDIGCDVFPVDSHLLVVPCCHGDAVVEECFLFECGTGSVSDAEVKVDAPHATALTTFRVQAAVKLECSYFEENANQTAAHLTAAEERLQQELQDSSAAFLVNGWNTVLPVVPHSSGEISASGSATVADRFQPQAAKMRASGSQHSPLGSENIVAVQYLRKLTVCGGKTSNHVPVLLQKVEKGSLLSLELGLDVLVLCQPSTAVDSLGQVFSSALCQQLTAMCKFVQHREKIAQLQSPAAYHFRPPSFSHPITVIYPHQHHDGSVIMDTELEDVRRDLHQRFALPLNQPLLRKDLSLFTKREKEIYLMNTHIGLKPSGVVGGEVCAVQGTYSYHHYMQDHFNDDGWGCAYRSLQTLWSWFRHQGYTRKSAPTHREIQQALVDMEDKPAKFIGSKQWIGSIEVQAVLNHLLGIDSKILFVSAGSNMPSHAREIAEHFSKQGTPIMIGGGVLAHTILGIDFNDRTGDVKFLILDPHYTGGEDLRIIQSKGWCGWKGPAFWDQQAHYNLCMPLHPSAI